MSVIITWPPPAKERGGGGCVHTNSCRQWWTRQTCCYNAHVTYTLIIGEQNEYKFLSYDEGQHNLGDSITNRLTAYELSPYSFFNYRNRHLQLSALTVSSVTCWTRIQCNDETLSNVSVLWFLDDLGEMGLSGMDWIDLAQDRDQSRAFVNTVINLRVS
jgi:hypothetical protein